MTKMIEIGRVRVTIEPKRAFFTRVGYRARITAEGVELDALAFYGRDGRKVRAEAKRWAINRAKLFA